MNTNLPTTFAQLQTESGAEPQPHSQLQPAATPLPSLNDLKSHCACLHVRVPIAIFTPADLVPPIHARLRELDRHPGRDSGPWSADFSDWRDQTDALHQILADLRRLDSPIPQPNPSHLPKPNPADNPPPPVPAPQNPQSPIPAPVPSHPVPASNPPQPLHNQPPSRIVPPFFKHPSPPNPTSQIPTKPNQPSTCHSPNPESKQSKQSKTPLPPPPPRASAPPSPFSALLAKKSRADDKLFTLPRHDQLTLLSWLESSLSCADVADRAALPRSQGGLGLKTSKSAVHRFFQKFKLNEKLAHAAQNVAASQTAAPDPIAALELLLQSQALEAASSTDFSPRLFQLLSQFHSRLKTHQIRHRALDLHHKRLAFHMQTFQFQTFQRFMQKLPELNKTLARRDLTPEQIVHEAYREAFGVQAVDTVEEANANYRQSFPDADLSAAEPEIDAAQLIQPHEDFNTRSRQGIAFFQKTLGVLPDDPQLHADADAFRQRLIDENAARRRSAESRVAPEENPCP